MENEKTNKNEKSAKDLAWELFKSSGNINYYRLYSDLKDENER